jgi:hypothetical protein
LGGNRKLLVSVLGFLGIGLELQPPIFRLTSREVMIWLALYIHFQARSLGGGSSAAKIVINSQNHSYANKL